MNVYEYIQNSQGRQRLCHPREPGFVYCKFANFVLQISELTSSHLSNKKYLIKVKCAILIGLSRLLIVVIIKKIVDHVLW